MKTQNIPPLFFGHTSADKPIFVHFIGIGGIGMSALARWFLAQNWHVSGSDLKATDLTAEIRKDGILVKIGHKKANVHPKASLVVYSQAIQTENPELRETRRRSIPALSYPEMVGRLTKLYRTIAVAGSHGKSTTTALTGLILAKAGLDPTVIVGTKLKEFGSPSTHSPRPGSWQTGQAISAPKNFRSGKGAYLVLEADEYGGAFFHYFPFISVITNIDAEHLDIYKDLAGAKEGFLQFLSNTARGGFFILNRDDKNLFSLKAKIEKIAHGKTIRTVWFSVKDAERKEIKKVIQISGTHNLSNALAAAAVANAIHIPPSQALAAISEFRGSWRRMEYRGEFKILNHKSQISVYDDYAHHPTEIKASLAAFMEKYRKEQIICVFQPHQAERLKLLFKEFLKAFDGADITLIAPIYHVAGRDPSAKLIKASHSTKKFDSQALVRAIQKRPGKRRVFYLPDLKNVRQALTAILSPDMSDPKCAPPKRKKRASLSSVVVMMGAGNIFEYTRLLL